MFMFFFFQAEDGIRDGHVTGVQTCALPILVGPATELLLTEEDILAGANRIETALANTLKKTKTPEAKEKLMTVMEQDLERLKNLEHFNEMHKYIGFLYYNTDSLLDYLPTDDLIIF